MLEDIVLNAPIDDIMTNTGIDNTIKSCIRMRIVITTIQCVFQQICPKYLYFDAPNNYNVVIKRKACLSLLKIKSLFSKVRLALLCYN